MDELGTTGRLLEVLSLLQARPHWSGPELADRLGVTVRTVRRDVERLRGLGYPVLADTGAAGGYRLGAGGRAMPPLMLDREEAVAVAVCLRSAATDTLAGGGEAAVRALGKLELLLPPTLRRHVGTIGSMTARLGGAGNPVVAGRARRHHPRVPRLRAAAGPLPRRPRPRHGPDHRSVPRRQHGAPLVPRRTRPRPGRLAHVPRRPHRRRCSRPATVSHIDDPPDPVAFVQSSITTAPYRHHAPRRARRAARRARPTSCRRPSACWKRSTSDHTLLTTGADDLDLLTFHLLSLGVDFRVVETDALREHLARAAERLANAVRAPR